MSLKLHTFCLLSQLAAAVGVAPPVAMPYAAPTKTYPKFAASLASQAVGVQGGHAAVATGASASRPFTYLRGSDALKGPSSVLAPGHIDLRRAERKLIEILGSSSLTTAAMHAEARALRLPKIANGEPSLPALLGMLEGAKPPHFRFSKDLLVGDWVLEYANEQTPPVRKELSLYSEDDVVGFSMKLSLSDAGVIERNANILLRTGMTKHLSLHTGIAQGDMLSVFSMQDQDGDRMRVEIKYVGEALLVLQIDTGEDDAFGDNAFSHQPLPRTEVWRKVGRLDSESWSRTTPLLLWRFGLSDHVLRLGHMHAPSESKPRAFGVLAGDRMRTLALGTALVMLMLTVFVKAVVHAPCRKSARRRSCGDASSELVRTAALDTSTPTLDILRPLQAAGIEPLRVAAVRGSGVLVSGLHAHGLGAARQATCLAFSSSTARSRTISSGQKPRSLERSVRAAFDTTSEVYGANSVEDVVANASKLDLAAADEVYELWRDQFPIAAARRDYYGLRSDRVHVSARFLILAQMLGVSAKEACEIFSKDTWVLSEPSDKIAKKIEALTSLADSEDDVLDFLRAAPRSIATTTVAEMQKRGLVNMRVRSAIGEAYEFVAFPLRFVVKLSAKASAKEIEAEMAAQECAAEAEAQECEVDVLRTTREKDSDTLSALSVVFFGSLFGGLVYVGYMDANYGGPIHGKGFCFPAGIVPSYNIPDTEGNARLPCSCAPLYKWYIEPQLSSAQKLAMMDSAPKVESKNCGKNIVGGTNITCNPLTVGGCVWTAEDLEKDPSAWDRRELLFWERARLAKE